MKNNSKTVVCDKDCFNCKHPDCICDDMDADDYSVLKEIENQFIIPKGLREKKIAAYRRAYYEANKEQIKK